MSIDLLFLLFIIFFAIVGYVRGFINQAISVAMILSVIFFAKPLADWLKYDSGWKWLGASSELIVWGVSAFSILLMGMAIHGLILLIRKTPGLSPADHWVGLAFGALKGVLIVLLLGTVYLTLPEESRARFADLERDAKKSVFISISQNLADWEAVSSFRALRQAREKMKIAESDFDLFDNNEIVPEAIRPQKKSERKTPWIVPE